jgi:menaquinol-cytochrome c reductase iron-sulfur subunit
VNRKLQAIGIDSVAANDQERRNFLLGAIYTLPLLIGGTFAATIGRYLFGRTNTTADGWADAGDLTGFQKGSPRRLSFQRAEIDGWRVRNVKAEAWVVLDQNNKLTAFSPACTHLGCAYQWQPAAKAFKCPCHGSVFDIRGNVVAGPAGRPLDQLEVKVERNRLWLGPVQTRNNA